MKKKILFFVGALSAFLFSGSYGVAGGDYLYKSPNKLDFIKIDKAKRQEQEGGLKHPASIGPEQMKGILASIHFNKNVLIMKDVVDRQLFSERHVEFLASYIVDGLKKASDNQVVVVSYFTKDTKFLIQNNRLTIFRVFVKDDGLHVRFNKIYAKILGDRETKGALRASNEAVGINIALELQAGQSWVTVDPEEVLFDLNYDFAKGVPGQGVVKPRPPSADDAPAVSKRSKSAVAAEKADIRARLKELDALKKDDLITEKEYQKKRRDLLQEL